MPIQNRKIKLTLIFLLIFLSISAFSIIGIAIAFNTKDNATAPKAAHAYWDDAYDATTDTYTLRKYTNEKSKYDNGWWIFHDYRYKSEEDIQYAIKNVKNFKIESPEGFWTFNYLLAQGDDFKGKKVILGDDIDFNLTPHLFYFGDAVEVEYGVYYGNVFLGEFDGMGYSIIDFPFYSRGSSGIICAILGDGGEIRNLKIKNARMSLFNQDYSGQSDPHISGVIAGVVKNEAKIHSCIVEDVTVIHEDIFHYLGLIAGKNDGEIKNCITDGVLINGFADPRSNFNGVHENCRVYDFVAYPTDAYAERRSTKFAENCISNIKEREVIPETIEYNFATTKKEGYFCKGVYVNLDQNSEKNFYRSKMGVVGTNDTIEFSAYYNAYLYGLQDVSKYPTIVDEQETLDEVEQNTAWYKYYISDYGYNGYSPDSYEQKCVYLRAFIDWKTILFKVNDPQYGRLTATNFITGQTFEGDFEYWLPMARNASYGLDIFLDDNTTSNSLWCYGFESGIVAHSNSNPANGELYQFLGWKNRGNICTANFHIISKDIIFTEGIDQNSELIYDENLVSCEGLGEYTIIENQTEIKCVQYKDAESGKLVLEYRFKDIQNNDCVVKYTYSTSLQSSEYRTSFTLGENDSEIIQPRFRYVKYLLTFNPAEHVTLKVDGVVQSGICYLSVYKGDTVTCTKQTTNQLIFKYGTTTIEYKTDTNYYFDEIKVWVDGSLSNKTIVESFKDIQSTISLNLQAYRECKITFKEVDDTYLEIATNPVTVRSTDSITIDYDIYNRRLMYKCNGNVIATYHLVPNLIPDPDKGGTLLPATIDCATVTIKPAFVLWACKVTMNNDYTEFATLSDTETIYVEYGTRIEFDWKLLENGLLQYTYTFKFGETTVNTITYTTTNKIYQMDYLDLDSKTWNNGLDGYSAFLFSDEKLKEKEIKPTFGYRVYGGSYGGAK